jgi:hypothetical protein
MAAVDEQSKRIAAERRFATLAQAWKAETELVSKVGRKIIHPAYQKIIGMGEPAIPLILRDLRDYGPDDWFWALTAITDENPIRPDIAGNMVAMTEAWLAWGRKAGYLQDCPKPPNGSSPT